VVAGPVREQETIVYADIDLKLNEMARGIINITGLYSRWDILSLLVRENQYEPTVSMESLEAQAWAGAAGNGAPLPAGLSAALPAADPAATEVAALRARVEELEKELGTLKGD
jgi:hypothetical protein